MRLVIISHTAHYQSKDSYVGWGPTVREISFLATLFTEVHHVAFLHPGSPPGSALPYTAENLQFVPLKARGGEKIADKLLLLMQLPQYTLKLYREILWADVVHIRCPASISLIAIVLLAIMRSPKKRWIKYAGNWKPTTPEAWSYRFQRWWLSQNFPRGVVTVNGEWLDQPRHIASFFNPCLSTEEWNFAHSWADSKKLSQPLHLVFVGRVEKAKGTHHTITVVKELLERGIEVQLDIIGDGPEKKQLEQAVQVNGLTSKINFRGWVPHTALGEYYRHAHFMVLPTISEGWPKVLSEAMAYGAIPLAGSVSSIPQYLTTFECGRAISGEDIPAYVAAIKTYLSSTELWKKESVKASLAARNFTYENYLSRVHKLLDL